MNKDTNKELSAKAHQTSTTETQQIPTTALCAGANSKADSETHSETDTQKKSDILIQPRGIKREVADDFADPRASAPKEDLSIENSLEVQAMSRSERHRYYKARKGLETAGMTAGEKFRHFMDCNKWKLMGVFMIVVSLTWISLAVYSNTRPTALSYAVANSPNPWDVNTSVFNDYKSFYNYSDSAKIKDMQNLHYDPATYNDNYDANGTEYSSFPLLCEDNVYDVMFSDKGGVDCLSYLNLIHPLDTYSGTLKTLFDGPLSDYVITDQDSANHTSAYAIDISDTDFAKDLNLGYGNVYLSFPGNSEENVEHIVKLLNYIFDLGINTDNIEQ